MMKRLLLYSLVSFLVVLAGCTNDDAAPCSKAENVNNPECQKQIPGVDTRPLTLQVNFVDSSFYDQNTQSWIDLKKQNLEGGIVGVTIPIYSDFLNQSINSVMPRILSAKNQRANPGTYPVSDYNRVPFIEVALEEGAEYLFDYTKINTNNQVVYQKQGNLIVRDGRAILPLVNETFDGEFFSGAANLGSRFTHTIAIAAQSRNAVGTRTNTIVFEAVLQIPNTDFSVKYTQATRDFNLRNRWNYYYNGTDGVPNRNFHFITLEEIKETSEQVPLDLEISFKEPPAVKVVQNVFFEMPFDIEAIKNSSVVAPQRGYSFYVQRQELTGTLPSPIGAGPDIQMKLRVNGQELALVSGRTAEISLPAGVPWNIDVLYDFMQHTNYTSPSGTGVITPLRPVCHQHKNENFSPITEKTAKDVAIASGGYLSICHPDENRQVIISQNQMSTTPYALTDTWYGHFSYVPFDMFKREVGHLYGIRDVTLRMEGCVRVRVRQQGETQYQIKTKSHSVCDTPGGGANQGWVYFYAEKQSTIFENINDYEGISGLKALLQSFGSRPIKETADFYFNNSDLKPTRKIY